MKTTIFTLMGICNFVILNFECSNFENNNKISEFSQENIVTCNNRLKKILVPIIPQKNDQYKKYDEYDERNIFLKKNVTCNNRLKKILAPIIPQKNDQEKLDDKNSISGNSKCVISPRKRVQPSEKDSSRKDNQVKKLRIKIPSCEQNVTDALGNCLIYNETVSKKSENSFLKKDCLQNPKHVTFGTVTEYDKNGIPTNIKIFNF